MRCQQQVGSLKPRWLLTPHKVFGADLARPAAIFTTVMARYSTSVLPPTKLELVPLDLY